jgi:lauroyl/myristoyl acyltransferase
VADVPWIAVAAPEARPDLDSAIAELDRPRAHELNVEGRSPLGRLYSTEALHRLVPDPVAMRIAWTVGWLRWYWPPARRRALARVSLTVARTRREHEARALARRELSIQAMRVELEWRPWMLDRAPFEGLERLERVRAGGRPMLLTGAHIGGGGSPAVARRGYPYAAAAGAWLDPRSTGQRRGYHGYKARARRRRAEALGIRYVPVGGSYELLRALLERGDTCHVLCDIPGSMRTRMAGKAARLASGPAALACETGAIVLPIVGLLHVDGPHVEILEPIDPRATSGPQEIVDRLAEIYGELMVRHPEQVEPIGFTRGTFAEDSEGYPPDLWWPGPLRERVARRAGRIGARLRRRVAR